MTPLPISNRLAVKAEKAKFKAAQKNLAVFNHGRENILHQIINSSAPDWGSLVLKPLKY